MQYISAQYRPGNMFTWLLAVWLSHFRICDTIPNINNTYFLIVTGCGAFPQFTGHQISEIRPQLGAVLFCSGTGLTTVLDCVDGLWNDTLPVCNDCTYRYFH